MSKSNQNGIKRAPEILVRPSWRIIVDLQLPTDGMAPVIHQIQQGCPGRPQGSRRPEAAGKGRGGLGGTGG